MAAGLEAKVEEAERKREELGRDDPPRRRRARHGRGPRRRRRARGAAGGRCLRRRRSGRALPLDHGAFSGCEVGELDGDLEEAIERGRARRVRRAGGRRLRASRRARGRRSGRTHSACRGRARPGLPRAFDRAAVAGGRARSTSVQSRSPVTGPPFTREEEDTLEYLAGQAVVSIENASLHEAVERQAITDELTGLANLTRLHLDSRPRARAPAALRAPARARDDRPRRLQARERHLRPSAGRRGACARGVGAARRRRAISTRLPATAARSWRRCCRRPTPAARPLLAERMREAMANLHIPRVGGGGRSR